MTPISTAGPSPSPPRPAPQVHVVDDDSAVRTALVRLLAAHGYAVRPHGSGEGLLASLAHDAHGCVILDLNLEGQGGLAVQQRVASSDRALPIIFLTGCGDVPTCAGAMRGGAVDFLTKPVDEAVLLEAVARAVALDAAWWSARALRTSAEDRLARLTPREREVLTHVMNGRLNKQIASDLGTAEKTVKVHRARAMEKMKVRSVAELVRLVERAHADPGRPA